MAVEFLERLSSCVLIHSYGIHFLSVLFEGQIIDNEVVVINGMANDTNGLVNKQIQ